MKPKAGRKRLDLLLVERGCAASPQKALAMILAGEVQVDGQRVEKAGTPVAEDASIEIISRVQKFVGRGGVKLEGALEDFAIKPAGCVCLDIGSSIGGFTDCLLQQGAERVYAVDVNVEQLDWKLRQNPRVIPIERNARELRVEHLPETVDIVKDKTLHHKAILTVRECVESVGLDYLGVLPSHLLGAEGNQEYFLHARKKALE